jgi:uncharacterized membrane protein YqaE (UPF0057 family)
MQILAIFYLDKTYFLYLSHVIIKVNVMSVWRVLLAIIFPPLSVIDKGCGSILIVFILWILGWVPGVIAALIILNNPNN